MIISSIVKKIWFEELKFPIGLLQIGPKSVITEFSGVQLRCRCERKTLKKLAIAKTTYVIKTESRAFLSVGLQKARILFTPLRIA